MKVMDHAVDVYKYEMTKFTNAAWVIVCAPVLEQGRFLTSAICDLYQ